MKKLLLISLALVFAFTMFVPQAMAGGNGPAGKSNVGHVYLYEKTPAALNAPWEIVSGGAWGKMQYGLSGETFDFNFNGHGLPVGVSFTLIYYPDIDGNPWPRTGIICLGNGVVNGGGNVRIAGSVLMIESLPTSVDDGDINYGYVGAKIWLVLSDDVDCDTNTMSGWNPNDYLFEGDVISFTYTGP